MSSLAYSSGRLRWDLVVVFVSTVAAFGIPLRVVLGDGIVPGWVLYDHLVTVVFVLDIAVRARRLSWSIAAYTPWELVGDVIAATPFAIVLGSPAAALLRLVKLFRIVQIMRMWWHEYASSWNVLRLFYSTYWIRLMVHWLTSGWLGLRGVEPGFTAWDSYIRALYWCVVTLTSVGYGDITPKTNVEMLYAVGVMISGVGMYGYVIGNVAHILTNLHPSRVRYVENMEKLNAFLHYRDVPEGLQERIREYYKYVWEKRLGFDESSIVSTLSPGLQAELSLFLKRDVLEKVPFLKGASDPLIREIALAMKPQIYMPGDFIVRAGEAGNEMFFIDRGSVEVLSKDAKTAQAVLSDGDFFGEFALLLGRPRTASVRAVGYCDLYALDKETFDRVIGRYPEFAEHIRRMIEERTVRNQ